MLFHINSFSATILDLQYLEWYVFISIYQINTQNFKANVQEGHIKIR